MALMTDWPQPRERTLLAMGVDAAWGERFSQVAGARGWQAQLAKSPAEARIALAALRPDAVLLNLEAGRKLLKEAAALAPVVVLSAGDSFADRLAVARLGGRAFLTWPVVPEKALEAVTAVLEQQEAVHARVMALDDDPFVLKALELVLLPRSVRLTTLTDPLALWDRLSEETPDLLILDVEIPQISGIEICRVLRNDPCYRSLPVLFLTARTDPATLRRIFAAGADDFVSKPIVPPELLTRVINRLERNHLLRSLAEVDPLTGVANRSSSEQALDQMMRLARRQGRPMAMAVLDLDHFKRVNDRYGHATGDLVLRRLGRLLRQSFRGEDAVARWGGEEFVLGLPGLDRSRAAARITQLLETFRQTTFTAPAGEPFSVTFSAGVVEYPADGADLSSLYRAADEVLYQAKGAGRNRVLFKGYLLW